MANTQQVNIGGGSWFLSALSLIFVVGKIWGPLESWSWWAVFAPIWVPFALFLVLSIFLLACAGLRAVLK